MKQLFLISACLLLLVGCQTTHQSPPSSGKIDALGASIQKIASDHQKTAGSPEAAQAFQEIYNESGMLLVANAEQEKLIGDLQSKLKSAQDTTELRHSLVWLAPAFLIACCGLFAAWGYFKFRWLEYAAVAAGSISIGSIVLYLAIQTIQSVLVWLVPAGVGLAVAYAVYWFIKNRKKTVTEMQASTIAALNNDRADAQAIINGIQSPATKAIVAQATDLIPAAMYAKAKSIPLSNVPASAPS